MDKHKARNSIIWGVVVLWVIIVVGVMTVIMLSVATGSAQVTPGTVFSKTEDGNGNKIGSNGVGNSLNIFCTGGSCGGASSTYLDADGIANQTASAVHGQTYLYDPVGLNWNRARGDTTNGMWVNCKLGCGSSGGASSIADTGNSTLITLGIGGNFTGAAFDLTNYASWSVSVFSNVSSAASGWAIEWSEDNVNWGGSDAITYVGGFQDMVNFGHKARYVRINYTNGGVAQATFRVYAWGHTFVRQSRHFIGQLLDDQDSGQIVTAALQGHTTAGGGGWVPVKVNPSGAMTAEVTQAAASNPWIISGVVTNANLDVALSTRLADATFTGRFTAASVDADAIANETTTSIHGKCYLYNGATWDRCRGAITTGLLVNISNASIAVTQSTSPWVVSGTVGVSNAFLLDATFTGRINTLGQKAMAASTPVVLPSDQSAIPVTVLSTVGTANNDGACPSGAANFTVAASNASRTWLAIWASPANTDDVYIKLGATATNVDGRISPGQPINFTSGRIYTGQIDAFPNSGTQAVCLMELN